MREGRGLAHDLRRTPAYKYECKRSVRRYWFPPADSHYEHRVSKHHDSRQAPHAARCSWLTDSLVVSADATASIIQSRAFRCCHSSAKAANASGIAAQHSGSPGGSCAPCACAVSRRSHSMTPRSRCTSAALPPGVLFNATAPTQCRISHGAALIRWLRDRASTHTADSREEARLLIKITKVRRCLCGHQSFEQAGVCSP